MRRLAYLYDPIFLEHDPGPAHAECPARLRTVQEYLTAQNVFSRADLRSCPPATREQLMLIHTEDYIDFVLKHRGVEQAMLDDGDTFISSASVDAALVAAGTAIEAVDLVFNQDYDSVFAAVRPPGHHARPGQAMGFCIFNNIALCAAHALRTRDIDQVLIVDWDVHHGNGTQEMFYTRDDVYFLSIHQSPFYPRTGAEGEMGSGPGLGYTRNIPRLARKDDAHYVDQLRLALEEVASICQPQLVLISAGFDAHAADPIGGMKLSEQGFLEMTRLLTDFAHSHAHGRIISFLEGGYDHPALAKCVNTHLQGLME
jgi:acetoin utilization deacetylase AcuC-like enzyme